jgi:hypothetical protein
VLVTLGNWHHLDGSMVNGTVIITERACGWLDSTLYTIIVKGSPWWRDKELYHREHLVLARTKEGNTHAHVLQQGLMGGANSPRPRKIIKKSSNICFAILTYIWSIYFKYLPYQNYHASIGLETIVQNCCYYLSICLWFVENLERFVSFIILWFVFLYLDYQ